VSDTRPSMHAAGAVLDRPAASCQPAEGNLGNYPWDGRVRPPWIVECMRLPGDAFVTMGRVHVRPDNRSRTLLVRVVLVREFPAAVLTSVDPRPPKNTTFSPGVLSPSAAATEDASASAIAPPATWQPMRDTPPRARGSIGTRLPGH
jgi:hypothetical protein